MTEAIIACIAILAMAAFVIFAFGPWILREIMDKADEWRDIIDEIREDRKNGNG